MSRECRFPTPRRPGRYAAALTALAGALLGATAASAQTASAQTASAQAASAQAASAATVAITGGTVYPVSGPKIERGTVLIRDGRIVAVGAEVSIPADAVRVDASGRWVTPGLFHPATDLGLSLFQTGGQEETRENVKQGDVDAAFNVGEGIYPAALPIGEARLGGITTALSAPVDGLIAGQAVVIDLAGPSVERMLVRSPAAMVIDLSEQSKSAGGGSRAGVIQRLRDILRDAQEYDRRRNDFRRAEIQPLAASEEDLEALQPVLRGELPVYAIANRRSDIEAALRLAREFKLRLILWGGIEAWQLAPELARAGVPVVVNSRVDRPSFDAPGARLDNAALLRRAGVTVLLSDEDPRQNFSSHFRTLRHAAGEAVRNGMAWDDALAAITLHPARAFGVADRYGSLEPGKVANVVVWSGDPFEFASRAERVYIRGEEIPLKSRQTELLERYRTVPPPWTTGGGQ
ncbi:MAG TPA: amidohydrolase family protein [Gemmatimonadales bacterium]|nr:amidohydrolase family protein [Gemmatimonadales bacterium]